jgi:ABC-type polysaccharide/polyol phosphate transport system ATPase subunit
MISVIARDVCKKFPLRTGRRSLFRFFRGQPGILRSDSDTTVTALERVNLTVRSGERVALIGNNAAGKTTLLKLMAGLLRPTSGEIEVNADRILLTSLGIGMMDELTIEENIILYGAFYGLNRKRIHVLLPEILEWAEIERYRGARLKTLSLGMRSRLAFSVVRHMDADVFLLDEALSAGDAGFREKCNQFFEAPKNAKCAFLIASHDLEFVSSFSTKAVWLDEGRIIESGDSRVVVKNYLRSLGLAHKEESRARRAGSS